MSEKELNIKSSTIEKGLELAKEFLGKLISPTIEELGLLVSDNVRYLRFKNQIDMLLKAKKYVEKRGTPIKEIPIKILVPLLNNASLEENDELKDRWAKMLANLVDSETNLQNQIFPYILSQISIDEFNALKELQIKEKNHLFNLQEWRKVPEKEKWFPSKELKDLKEEIDEVEQNGFWVSLEQFEYSNLERLGLLMRLPPKIYINEFQTGDEERWHNLKAEYITDEFGYRLTELGEKFIAICEVVDQ